MKRTLLRNGLITASALLLSGCLAVNALLGVAGIVGSGPFQYAGVVYSVSEYTYEYAMNDRTPDEVMERKLAWLGTEPQPDLVPPPQLDGYARAMRNAKLAAATGGIELPTPQHTTPTPLASQPQLVVAKASIPRTDTAFTPTRPASPPEQHPTPVKKTLHTYVEHSPDPLLTRLSRLNQTLRLAEQMMEREPASGVRCSVTHDDAGQHHGVNGTWSIRHPVMQYPASMDLRQGV